MINYLKGDATDPQIKGPKIITHICNNRGGWGKGFVLSISKRWKKPESSYREWFKSGKDFGLGKVQFVKVRGDILVVNMIAQEGFKSVNKEPPIRYEALKECLMVVKEEAKKYGASVHMPYIGTGLAGGDWKIIRVMIEEVFGRDVCVYVYEYG